MNRYSLLDMPHIYMASPVYVFLYALLDKKKWQIVRHIFDKQMVFLQCGSSYEQLVQMNEQNVFLLEKQIINVVIFKELLMRTTNMTLIFSFSCMYLVMCY